MRERRLKADSYQRMELPSTETQQLWVEQIWRNMRGAILDMSCLLDTQRKKWSM
jgi:hypothetical protein